MTRSRRGGLVIDFILPVSHHEYQLLIFLGQIFAAIGVLGIVGAIVSPKEF